MDTGLSGDYVKDYGFAVLPRLSMLFKFSSKLSSRIGGGWVKNSQRFLPKKVKGYYIRMYYHRSGRK
jgi:hypothetical protein